MLSFGVCLRLSQKVVYCLVGGIIAHRVPSWLFFPDILHSTPQHWKLPSRKGVSISVLAWLFCRLQSRCMVSLVAGLTIWFWWATKTSGNDPIGISLTNNSWGGISCLVLGFWFTNLWLLEATLSTHAGYLCSNRFLKIYVFKQVCKIVVFSMTFHASLVLVIFPHSHPSFVPPHSYPCLNISVPRTPTLYFHTTCVLSLFGVSAREDCTDMDLSQQKTIYQLACSYIRCSRSQCSTEVVF